MGTVNVTLGDGKKLNLILGQQLENAVTAVVFDFSAWQTEFGSGTLGLSVQRHGDTQPYAVVPTVSGTNATWNISELDTAYKGVGEVQVTYTVGTKVKKSVVYKFTVQRSLGENGEYPSPGQTWQEEIEDELADVKQDLGDLDDLQTTVKTDLVSAINEAAQSGGGSGGSPKGITLASQMTDTDENYLYLGNETGYDYGYIYVYLNDAWTKTTLYGKGQNGANGQDGADGYSPTASVTQTETGATITITDENGTTTASVNNGSATDAQVETYINAWLNEHPEATTTVEDGSITQTKLAFDAVEGVLSPNLIDMSTVIDARFTNVNGSIQNLAGTGYANYFRMTDYIDVSAHIGEYISVINHNGYCFYTSAKSAIAGSGESLGLNYPSDMSKDPILIPSDAYYVRLVYWYRDDARTSPMANFGTTLLSYSEYGNVLLKPKSVFNDNLGEKISFDNIENITIAEKVVSNNLIPPTNIMKDYDFDNSTGQPKSVASGYYSALTDYIPVNGNTAYYGLFKNRVAFYDESKNYLSYSTSNPFTTPSLCKYIRLLINATGYGTYAYYNHFYLVEGNERPIYVYPYGSYIPKDSMEMFSSYKSVLDRLNPLYNPTIKTAIGIYGDSNTAGLSSGASGTYYQNCWANLICSRIQNLFDRDTTIYPLRKYGSWYGTEYSGTMLLQNASSFVSLDFYGSTLKINFGQTQKGVASILIDDNEPVSFDTNNGTQYIAEGLSEDNHTLIILRTSGSAVQVSSIVVHNYVTASNLGVTGQGSSSLPISNTAYDIYITVYGTNDRSRSIDFIENNHFIFAKTQMSRGAEVIMITPTPATDGFETGSQTGIKMAEVESAVAEANGVCNLEHISFYQYLLNYCTYTGTSLNSLFNDTLHMKESTHAIIYKFLCDKLGLGQPIDDYLPS